MLYSKSIKFMYYPRRHRRKLNVHKTFRGRPGRFLNVLCTFNLRPNVLCLQGYVFPLKRTWICLVVNVDFKLVFHNFTFSLVYFFREEDALFRFFVIPFYFLSNKFDTKYIGILSLSYWDIKIFFLRFFFFILCLIKWGFVALQLKANSTR